MIDTVIDPARGPVERTLVGAAHTEKTAGALPALWMLTSEGDAAPAATCRCAALRLMFRCPAAAAASAAERSIMADTRERFFACIPLSAIRDPSHMELYRTA